MPGSVAPDGDNYAVVVSEKVVADADCGLNSHEVSTLEQLVTDVARRSDALSDPDDPQVESMIAVRINEGWSLVGCSRIGFEAVTPGVDHEALVHRIEDAVLIWKRSRKRSERQGPAAAS